MDFSNALSWLKSGDGRKVFRVGWNGKGMWLEIQRPDDRSQMTRPYIYMCLPFGSTQQFGDASKLMDRVPWLASQTDLLAEDWVIKE